ncbi:MAG: CDP-diacylglycerol--glycerol-3-phosphate 3-phosphatidyltransferase [Ruminococcus sp.]|nr:CDP-diacylglycerol--glycerol-3-phosphate 3-phosphatidyltransferase [Ruminococcus sp.]
MNLPNRLTMLRIILVPFFAIFLSIGELIFTVKINYIAALIIFVVASITDFLDGYISREYDLETTFGKFADPLADKILVAAALVCFCYLKIVNPIPVIIILAREFMVSGLRLVVADKGIVVSAGIWGKLKTAFTMVTIIFILVSLIMMDGGNTGLNATLSLIFTIMLWISVLLTVISGFIYLNAYKKYISDM